MLLALLLVLLAGDVREVLGGGGAEAERRRRRVGGRSGSRAGRRQPEATWGGLFLSVTMRARVIRCGPLGR